jgi:hypothetical protein
MKDAITPINLVSDLFDNKNLGEFLDDHVLCKELDSHRKKELQYYIEAILSNNMAVSRTVRNGSIDISTEAVKIDALCKESWGKLSDEQREQVRNLKKVAIFDLDSLISKDTSEIKFLIKRNIVEAIIMAYSFAGSEEFTAKSVQSFIETIYTTLNDGILKKESGDNMNWIYRSHSGGKHPYLHENDVLEGVRGFYRNYSELLGSSANSQNPSEIAAWVEYKVNLTGHYFADGCGKMASIISSIILMKHSHKIPVFKDTRDYFSQGVPLNIVEERSLEKDKETKEFNSWLTAYRHKFPDLAALQDNLGIEGKGGNGDGGVGIHQSFAAKVLAEREEENSIKGGAVGK